MPDPATPAGASAPATVTVHAGDTLFHEGERHATLYVIESGQIALLARTPSGTHQVALLGRGDLLGDDVTFEKRPARFTARAVADAALLKIDLETFQDLVRIRPEVARVLVAALGRRLSDARLARPAHEAPAAIEAPAPSPPRFVQLASGVTLPLPPGPSVLIGRADERTRFRPDVDLSPLDDGRSLSRRHAVLQVTEGRYVLIEQPHVANGTFVNGVRVTPAVPVPISDGDEVRFGLVRLVFHVG